MVDECPKQVAHMVEECSKKLNMVDELPKSCTCFMSSKKFVVVIAIGRDLLEKHGGHIC